MKGKAGKRRRRKKRLAPRVEWWRRPVVRQPVVRRPAPAPGRPWGGQVELPWAIPGGAAVAEPGPATARRVYLPEVMREYVRPPVVIPEPVLPTGLGVQLPAGMPLETWYRAAPWATAERTWRRVKRAWEAVGKPREEYALPGELARVREVLAEEERGLPEEVTRPGAWMLGPGWVPPAELRPEEAAKGLEKTAAVAGAVAGLIGAGWQSVKQMPWVGKPARTVEALAKSAIEVVYQAPVLAVEETIGKGWQRLPGEKGLWPLEPERHLTDEQRVKVEALEEAISSQVQERGGGGGARVAKGLPRWLAAQAVLLESRLGTPSIRELAVELYGAGPQTEEALGWLALMGYSSYEAKVEGLHRLRAGEDIEAVISGRRIDTYEPSEEDIGAFRAYVAGVGAADGPEAAEAAVQRVKETGVIPGSSDLGNEMLFQIGLDPLNLLDIGAWKRTAEMRHARATGRVGEVAAQYADEMADGLKAATAGAEETVRAMGRVEDANNARGLRAMLETVNPLAPTPRAQAETWAAAMYQVVTPGVMEAGSADEAAAIMKAMVEDPQRLAAALGPLPVSQAAAEARPVLEAVVGRLDEFKSLRGEFSPARFIEELDRIGMDEALRIAGETGQVSGYRKFADGYRHTTSQFYLTTPGYAIRNALGDWFNMAWDGVLTLSSRTHIDDYLERFGVTTRRITRRAGGAQTTAEIMGKGLPEWTGPVGKATSWMSQRIRQAEELRYNRAFATALEQTVNATWTPRLADDIVDLLPAQMARALETRLAGCVTEAERLTAVEKLFGAEGAGALVDLSRYVGPDDLSVGLRLHLETELGKVTDVAGAGVDEVLDDAVRMVETKAAEAFAACPTSPTRGMWSQFEALQDMQEGQGELAGVGKLLGVDEAEVARRQAELADALVPGQRAIDAATDAFSAQAATGFSDEAAAVVRQARAKAGRANIQARASVDALRAEVWKAIEEGEDAGMLWDAYFPERTRLWVASQGEQVRWLDEGSEALKRLARGEELEAVTGRTAKALADEALEGLRVLAGDVAARQEKLRRLGMEDFVDFDKMLDARRLGVDIGEAEMWRVLAMNPGSDGLDIVMEAQDWVIRAGRATAKEVDDARNLMLAGRITPREFHAIAELEWGKWFTEAPQRLGMAQWELAQLPISRPGQLKGLAALGWPVEAAEKLSSQEVGVVLGAGVRWDGLMGAPSMPLAEAMRGTLGEVAQAAGLDGARVADWTAAQWDSMALVADGLKQEAGSKASVAGRMGQAALEVRAEAVVGAPRTVEAGMELAWPASVDDVARSMGIRPKRAGAKEWGRVAEYCEEKGVAARLLGDEFGRSSMAAQMAGRTPEERVSTVFGTREVRVRTGRMSFAQEMEEMRGLTGKAREAAEETVGWVLREAGFSGDEIGQLNFQQKGRLLEEMGQGQLLRTPSGVPSQIDKIAVERRAELLREASAQVKEVAFGVGMDPEAAEAYRWLEVGEEAQGLAGGGKHTAVAPGMYDAAGRPVARGAGVEVVAARPQREIVERAVGMVPEAERIGPVGRAGAGFEAQQARLAEKYGDISDMARARAGMLRDGRRFGETLDVPAGVVKATTRKEAGIYLLDLVDDEKRVIRTYWFEGWPETKRARNIAREVIAEGRQGQAVMVSTSPLTWGCDDVARANRRAAAAGGVRQPTLADVAAVVEQQELDALARVRGGLREDWDDLARAVPEGGVTRPVLNRVRQWVGAGLEPEWQKARAVGVETARLAADHALLDYAGGRKQVDNWLSMVYPYTFWKTRSARNWAIRLANRPAVLGQYVRYKDAVQRHNRERGYRGRFEGKVEVTAKFLPEWTGQALFVDPLGSVLPWGQLLGPDWVDDPAGADNAVEYIYWLGNKMGLRPYGFIEWPLQYYKWIGSKQEIGYALPQTGAIQALTTGAREVSPWAAERIPPGGMGMEAAVRRGVGLPEQEPYQPYRVSRMLADMAGDDPARTQTALMAMELQRLVAAGELGLNEAMGWGRGVEAGVGGNVGRLAQAEGWSVEELGGAQGMLAEAVQRAGLERGLPALTSFAAGVPVSMYPAGERKQVELQRGRRGAMWSPLTETGGREEMQAFEEVHPEEVTRRVMYGALPGEGEKGWKPGEAWKSREWKARSEEINRTYDEAVDGLLREMPWDPAGVRELEEQRRAELDVLRDEMGFEEEEGYRPWSVYGAGPEEAGEIRRREVLAAVSAAMPHVGDFRDEETGEVDYEGYEAARDGFFADLVGGMAGDERLAALGEAADVGPEGLLEGVTVEDVYAYWRRNDRPLEAAARVWEEGVYKAAWERYHQAVDGGMEKGEAWGRFIETVGGVRAVDLVEAIQAEYGERWTEEELRAELEGVEFPAVGEVSVLRKPEVEQELARAQSAFWDFYNEELPPGRMAAGARDYTLVQLVLDAETRGTATAEQYSRALEFMQGWKAENFNRDTWGTAADWAEARRLNEGFKVLAEEALPGIEGLLDRYYDLSLGERKEFKAENPEIQAYWDMREWFGAQEGNEVWAWFYLGEFYLGEGEGGPRRTALSTSGRRYYGGGAGAGERFAGTRYPPKVYLETPSPWEGYARPEGFGREFEARRGATPWLVQASRRVEPVPWLKSRW